MKRFTLVTLVLVAVLLAACGTPNVGDHLVATKNTELYQMIGVWPKPVVCSVPSGATVEVTAISDPNRATEVTIYTLNYQGCVGFRTELSDFQP